MPRCLAFMQLSRIDGSYQLLCKRTQKHPMITERTIVGIYLRYAPIDRPTSVSHYTPRVFGDAQASASLPERAAELVADASSTQCISRWGTMRSLLANIGRQFAAQLMQQLAGDSELIRESGFKQLLSRAMRRRIPSHDLVPISSREARSSPCPYCVNGGSPRCVQQD